MLDKEEAMKKYGLLWLKLNEEQGNFSYDLVQGEEFKNSNYREIGYNLKDYATNFSLSGGTLSEETYERINVPMGAFTIRFKFKTDFIDGTERTLFGSMGGIAGSNGVNVSIRSGFLTIGIETSGTTFDNFTLEYNAGIFVADNMWHDLFISWSGKKGDYIEVYLDNMEEPFVRRIAIADFNINNSPLTLGSNTGSTATRYVGFLSDFELYDKAFKPRDFSCDVVSIKGSNGEYYAINEYDKKLIKITDTNADKLLESHTRLDGDRLFISDGKSLDFTKIQGLEYSNRTSTVMGKGKVFSTPLPSTISEISTKI